MIKKFIFLSILTLFLISVMTLSVAAKSRVTDLRAEKLSQYGFLNNEKTTNTDGNETVTAKETPGQSLGITGDGNAPGETVAHTWYEYQHNSTMGRSIDWRAPNPQIHMAYTQMFGSSAGPRTLSYNLYDPESGTWPLTSDVGCAVSPASNARGGYANIDVDPSGAAVVAGHIRLSDNALDPTRTTVYWDATAPVGVYCGFGNGNRISDSLNDAYVLTAGSDVDYPKLEYQIFGGDTVALAFCCEFNAGADQMALVLFRKVGSTVGVPTDWTAFFVEDAWRSVQDITSSRVSQKVALVWLDEAAEDINGQCDIWYWSSNDMGATFDPNDKHNVTDYDPDEPGYRAWMEVSCLYDTDDHLHIIWNANIYEGDREDAQSRRGRLFHWADHTDVISTIRNAEWDPNLACGVGGSNVHNVGKFGISECNDKLYAIWVQWGDPYTGDTTDCADPDFVGAVAGYNGDIYLSVSTDLNGDKWDEARNLTNTKTPGCDDTEGNECDNESWPIISRYGMNNADFMDLDWSSAPQAYAVDPSREPDSPYTGNYYLDILYVNDLVPGSSVGGDNPTPATNVPLKWFRMPCVEPIIEARINLSPYEVVYPEYTSHHTAAAYDIRVENAGNADLNITEIGFVKNSYSSDDWLGIDATTMFITSGSDNIDTLVVTLNKGGVINDPGTVVNLEGHVFFEWERRFTIDTSYLTIDFFVADTIVGTSWDTISTNLIDLVVSSNGNMGNSNVGFVNMDFANTALECDDSSNYNATNIDTIPGDASVYLGNASPVILTGSVVGVDTTVTASWAIFQESFETANGFKPVTGEAAGGVKLTKMTDFEDLVVGYTAVHSGSFVTIDSNLVVEKTYYAPTDDVSYIIQMMRIFSFDGDAHSGLIIGEAYDWDIPSDTGSFNSSGTDPVSDLIYMLGSEFIDPLGDSLECTNNDTRAGGAARAGYYTQTEYNSNPTLVHTDPIWGGYVEVNEDYVYPAGGFIPNELYGNMLNNSGLNAQATSLNNEDLHLVLTHFNNYSLGASDTLIIWTVMATVPPTTAKDAVADLIAEINAGTAWLDANIADLKKAFTGCCIGLTGNADCAGSGEDPEEPDISDIVRVIDFLYLSHDPLCCLGEADVDASGPSNPEDPFSAVDISDIVFLIDHLYLSHKDLVPCP